MKNHIIKLLKFILLQIISFALLFGTVVFAALIGWPIITPSGETSGGNIIQYFNNIKGDCPDGKSLGGFNTDFTKNCINLPAATNTATCGGSIPLNAIQNIGPNYIQTWNGTIWTPTINWGESQTYCDFNYNTNYTWNGTSCEIAAYPGCNTADITIGSYTIAACNVGATTAGTGAASYGNYYQFGKSDNSWSTFNNLDWKSPGGTDAGSANDWGVTESVKSTTTYSNSNSIDQIKMQGPCATDYHVPTLKEWYDIHTAGGWSSKTVRDSILKLPYAGWIQSDGSPQSGGINDGFYWTSSPNTSYGYIMWLQANIGTPVGQVQRSAGISVRCIKN